MEEQRRGSSLAHTACLLPYCLAVCTPRPLPLIQSRGALVSLPGENLSRRIIPQWKCPAPCGKCAH